MISLSFDRDDTNSIVTPAPLPQVFATGYSTLPRLEDAIREVTDMALMLLPPLPRTMAMAVVHHRVL